MEKISFEFFGLTLMEPNMLLTNWLISFVGFYCAHKLHYLRKIPVLDDSYQLYFLLNAISAFLGGLAHLFILYTGTFFQAIAWVFTIASLYYLEKISIDYLEFKLQRTIKMFIRLKVFMMIIALIIIQSFWVVIADNAIGLLLIVGVIHLIEVIRLGKRGNLLIVISIALFALSGLFPILKISLHEAWFNFNDISHVFIAICLYIIYRGLLLLSEEELERRKIASTINS